MLECQVWPALDELLLLQQADRAITRQGNLRISLLLAGCNLLGRSIFASEHVREYDFEGLGLDVTLIFLPDLAVGSDDDRGGEAGQAQVLGQRLVLVGAEV